jgi:two-component system, OmpR family, response regulator
MSVQSKIIIIDDDAFFCETVKSYFRGEGVPIMVVTDPAMSRVIDYSQVDVVLLDIEMPGISGTEILNDIRKFARPFVIMVSGHGDEARRKACLSNGADMFFGKPINIEELFLVISRAIGRLPKAQAGQTWTLLRSRCALLTPERMTVGLSSAEFRLLEVLIRDSPNPVSKKALVASITDGDSLTSAYNRGLEVMLSRLRTRASSFTHKLPVKALRNVGYIFHGTGVVSES